MPCCTVFDIFHWYFVYTVTLEFLSLISLCHINANVSFQQMPWRICWWILPAPEPLPHRSRPSLPERRHLPGWTHSFRSQIQMSLPHRLQRLSLRDRRAQCVRLQTLSQRCHVHVTLPRQARLWVRHGLPWGPLRDRGLLRPTALQKWGNLQLGYILLHLHLPTRVYRTHLHFWYQRVQLLPLCLRILSKLVRILFVSISLFGLQWHISWRYHALWNFDVFHTLYIYQFRV